MIWVGWLAFTMSVGARVGKILKRPWGMGLSCVTGVPWLIYGVLIESWPMACVSAVYIAMDLAGYLKWRSDEQ